MSSASELRGRGGERKRERGKEREIEWCPGNRGETIGLVKAICHSEILLKLVSGSGSTEPFGGGPATYISSLLAALPEGWRGFLQSGPRRFV